MSRAAVKMSGVALLCARKWPSMTFDGRSNSLLVSIAPYVMQLRNSGDGPHQSEAADGRLVTMKSSWIRPIDVRGPKGNDLISDEMYAGDN
jgi:hypothetical protein